MSTSANAEWYNAQYDPRRSARPMPEIVGDWLERSRTSGLTPTSIAYGPSGLEVADIYRPEGGGRGVALFYHGGYWRSCSRHDHGWIAKPYLDQGLSVAIMDYPLCPEHSLAEIIEATLRAFRFLYGSVMTEAEKAEIIVSGHSAGGFLAALHRTIDWTRHGLPARPIHTIVALSGVFELEPLTHTMMNEWLRLTPEVARALSVSNKPAASDIPTLLAVGEGETSEFHRQSRELADFWPMTTYRSVANRKHFDILDALLTDPGLIIPYRQSVRPR